ncbi:MAG: class I SAM-dependent methyltransferase [Candidatus Helarchaeota archaeon]|nr:class I SAM-dependent methyltransferase [Candidatus Helarchaeota archaeon]
MGNRLFYEKYWTQNGGSPVEGDYALKERRSLLKNSVISLPKGSAIIDVGCGRGVFVKYLNELGLQTVGIDISFEALRKSRCTGGNCPLVVASLEEVLPFADNSFAAIYCSEVLEHIFSVHRALSELNRILISDGLLILTVPYHGILKNMAIALFGFEQHYDPHLSHIRFFTRKSLTQSLIKGGFKIMSWKGVGRWFPFWMSLFVIAKKVSLAGAEPEIKG